MSDIKVFYNDEGNVVPSSNDPATRQFYSDFLLIDRPLDAFGSLDEVKECDWTSEEYEFLFSNQRGLVGLFKSCSIEAENGQNISVWHDESGCENDMDSKSGSVKLTNGYVDLTASMDEEGSGEDSDIRFSRRVASGLSRDFTFISCFRIVNTPDLIEIITPFAFFEFGGGSDFYAALFLTLIKKSDGTTQSSSVIDIDVDESIFHDWTILTVKFGEQHAAIRINMNTVSTALMPGAGWMWFDQYNQKPEIGFRNIALEFSNSVSLYVSSVVTFSQELSDDECSFVESFLLERMNNV